MITKRSRFLLSMGSIAFLWLVLLGTVYFNDQVEFNTIEAKWELQDSYKINEIVTQQAFDYYLSFDGIDDYVEFNSSFNNSNTIILYDIDTYFSISKKIPNGHTSVIQYSFDSYPNGPNTQYNALTYVTELDSNYRYFRIIDFDQKYDPSVNSKIEIDLDNLQVIIDDSNIYDFNIWFTSGSYIPWDQVNANVRLNFYNRESNNSTNFFIESKQKLIEFYNDNNLLHQFEMNYIQNQLNDTVGNVVGNIFGATWVEDQIIETSVIYDSYDVFENIRNNASTVNPLGFMNTILSIPSQVAGYTRSVLSFFGTPTSDIQISQQMEENLNKWWWPRAIVPIIGGN